jgi:hypothetical protein
MTEQILSDRSHNNPIQIDNFVNYLHQHGWQRIDHPNTRLLVFQGVNDDRGYPIQIVLPSQNNFEDSDRLLAKAVNLLAAIDPRSTQETIDLLSSETQHSQIPG